MRETRLASTSEAPMTTTALFDWMSKLRSAKIHFAIASFRDDAVMLQVSVPGELWEVEFLSDGTIEVERFRSTGSIEGESALEDLLNRFSD
jgi:hypothetical protein